LPEQWTDGRITLLGDAAHPMMPDFAQGASTTFVDAAVLGDCFRSMATGTTPEEVLTEYELRRKEPAYEVVSLSQRGVFTKPEEGLASEDVDHIALRYLRYLERVDTSAIS
jgi:2-polyprenyl-6-methoxyphenol hydroxylase-like FAD-dependent oxidoreductase